MAHLNNKGPEEKGSKTGRKLGLCLKNDANVQKTGEIGKGMGKHLHNPNAPGNGKRINYYKSKQY